MAGGRTTNKPPRAEGHPALADYDPGEHKLIGNVQRHLDQGYSLKSFWYGMSDEHAESGKKRWEAWTTFRDAWKPKTPETWLTRRRASGRRRYTSTPEGGFSGALGMAAVHKKKLLGA